MADTWRLNCSILGPAVNRVFGIRITTDSTVDDLKDAIKEKNKNTLKNFDAGQLDIWKVNYTAQRAAYAIGDASDVFAPPIPFFETTIGDRLQGVIDGGKIIDAEKLEASMPVSSYLSGPSEPGRVDLVVQLLPPPPGATITPSTSAELNTYPQPTPDNDRPELTVKISSREDWRWLGHTDLTLNSIERAESSQYPQDQCLEGFQQRLGRKRYVDDDIGHTISVNLRLCPTLSATSEPFFNSHFESADQATTDNPALDRVRTEEIIHYTYVFGQEFRNKDNYRGRDKASQVRAFLLQFLAAVRLLQNAEHGFRSGFLIPFVVEVTEVTDGDQKFVYNPHPDFHVTIDGFPYIILEVNSQPNESDKYRMLLQAACIARMGHTLRRPEHINKPIFNMAIYIDGQFRAYQHILCQPHNSSPRVGYVTKVFNLTDPRSAFEFIFQLYNFISDAEAENQCLDRPQSRLSKAKESVEQKKLPSLSSAKRGPEEDQQNSTKRSKRNRGTSAGGGGSFDDPTVLKEVMNAGYTPTQPISEELTPLTPLPPMMRQATLRSSVLVVLKMTVDLNECRLLQSLNAIRAPSNHTIPLLDVINLSINKSIVVLPWKSPLDEALRFSDHPDDVVSLCLQFIEGVAFLHQHNVAHCDLKPGNVVVDAKSKSAVSPRLFIIDYDLALSVGSEETMVEGWCGTPPWIAPELGPRHGPTRQYSPILADRWSCGRMIQYFAKYFPTYEGTRKTSLLAFAHRLLNTNPRARPELSQLQAIHGPRKRKATS